MINLTLGEQFKYGSKQSFGKLVQALEVSHGPVSHIGTYARLVRDRSLHHAPTRGLDECRGGHRHSSVPGRPGTGVRGTCVAAVVLCVCRSPLAGRRKGWKEVSFS